MNNIAAVILWFKEPILYSLIGWNSNGQLVPYFQLYTKSVAVLTVALKIHIKTETIFAILMLFICLYLKGNVNATYLSIDENNKDMNETKSVIWC